jgi:hypothetical protein
VDKNLITAEHQMASQMWAESFCDVLENKAPAITLHEVEFKGGQWERKPIPGVEYLKKVFHDTGKTHIKKEDK